jgi:plasmid stabilization system protein ParE
MSLPVRFTPEAEETFDLLVSQLHQRWGDSVVIKFQAKVLNALTTVGNTPLIYPVTEEITCIRKCILHKNRSMLYKVYYNVILIVCFWDNRYNSIFNS